MNRRRSATLCLLVSCAGAAPPCSHRKNSRRIVPSNKRVRPRVRGQRRLADLLSRQAGQAAFCQVEMFSNYHRPRLRRERRWNYQPERAGLEEPAPPWRWEPAEPALLVEFQLWELSAPALV